MKNRSSSGYITHTVLRNMGYDKNSILSSSSIRSLSIKSYRSTLPQHHISSHLTSSHHTSSHLIRYFRFISSLIDQSVLFTLSNQTINLLLHNIQCATPLLTHLLPYYIEQSGDENGEGWSEEMEQICTVVVKECTQWGNW